MNSEKTTHYRMYMEYLGSASDDFIARWWNSNGLTITHGDGYWMGKHKHCVILDYVAHDYGTGVSAESIVKSFCRDYCKRFNQDCVMVTKTPVEWTMMERITNE